MKIRNVLKEFEAQIYPVQPNGKTRGKSEWKHYGDGSYRFKISVRNIPLPDDSKVDVLLDETHIAEIIVQSKMAKLNTENNIYIGIPNVKAGQRLQVKSGDLVLAEGQYIEE
jgi:hypothetical protein